MWAGTDPIFSRLPEPFTLESSFGLPSGRPLVQRQASPLTARSSLIYQLAFRTPGISPL